MISRYVLGSAVTWEGCTSEMHSKDIPGKGGAFRMVVTLGKEAFTVMSINTPNFKLYCNSFSTIYNSYTALPSTIKSPTPE